MRARQAWPTNAAVVNRSDAAAVRIAARELRRDRRNLSLQLAVVLSLGFGAVAAFSYTNAATAARKQVVESTLPLTLDALTADLQQELLRPVQFASSMAANSFLVDWLQQGEQPPGAIQTYLQRIQQQHGATTTFFVSEATGRYDHPTGLLKTVQATHSQDAWFYRLRSSPQAAPLLAQQPGIGPLPLRIHDHFKTINDRFGHPAGDAVIRRVSEQIRSLTRPQDLLFRWGGEEFLVLLPDTDLGEGCGILQRIPQAMAAAPVVCDGTPVIATLSIGITEMHAGDNGQEVLDRADRALYAAKSAGRNRIVSAH